MGEVVYLHPVDTQPVPPERVLRFAIDADLQDVIVIGHEQDGTPYLAFSHCEAAELLLALDKARYMLLRQLEVI